MYWKSKVWVHKTSLTPPLFIEVPVPSLEIKGSCICMLGISILPLSTIFLLHFGTITTMSYFLLFILFDCWFPFYIQN